MASITSTNLTKILSTSLNNPATLNHSILILKGICFALIIFTALFGNALVFIAILKFRRLRRIRTNAFLVSLAFADFLVALLAMPFNASMGLSDGRWVFGSFYCDIYNANDVLFSTASILHLCCISADRYIAILNPLNYERKMTRKRITMMLILTWTLSFLISYIPILTGLHRPLNLETKFPTTFEICDFDVNPYYAIVSSTTSFWLPGFIMVVLYIRIYHEARKQEKKILRLQLSPKQNRSMRLKHLLRSKNQNSNLPETRSTPELTNGMRSCVRLDSSTSYLDTRHPSPTPSTQKLSFVTHDEQVKLQHMKIRRESKAAKTLGIIMGAFLMCWLPFFLWYTITNMCGPQYCPYPPAIQEILFWIGYLNSTLNPIIYVFYNRTFRVAFAKVLECANPPSSDLGSGYDTLRTAAVGAAAAGGGGGRKLKLSQYCDRNGISGASSEKGS